MIEQVTAQRALLGTAKTPLPNWKHHYVPELLLKSWALENRAGQLQVSGYHWHPGKQKLLRRDLGVGGFCYGRDLFTVNHHDLGRTAVEQRFFGEVDCKGHKVIQKMIDGELDDLTKEQRIDFVRLFLSLYARQPAIVSALRDQGGEAYTKGLDADPRLIAETKKFNAVISPSDVFQAYSGLTMDDLGMLHVQRLTDEERVWRPIVKGHWHIRHVNRFEAKCALSDNPHIRSGPYSDSSTIWALPLTPSHLWLSTSSAEIYANLKSASTKRLVTTVNAELAKNATKYVFTIEPQNVAWIETRLRHNSEKPKEPVHLLLR